VLSVLSLSSLLFVILILSGLPDYVRAPFYVQDFWGVLDDTGHVHNWDGSVSPVVHQLDHFLGEVRVCDTLLLQFSPPFMPVPTVHAVHLFPL